MAYPDDAGALIVSLQDRSASSVPSVGHRGFGLLYGTDLAVVSVSPGVDWDSAFELEVLICPTGPDEDNAVERHRIWHLELASLESAPDARVILARLTTESRYATRPVRLPAYDVVVDSLSAQPELIRGLIDLNLFRAELVSLDASALAMVDALEERQRQRLQVDRLDRLPGSIANCIFSPKCQPDPPCD